MKTFEDFLFEKIEDPDKFRRNHRFLVQAINLSVKEWLMEYRKEYTSLPNSKGDLPAWAMLDILVDSLNGNNNIEVKKNE